MYKNLKPTPDVMKLLATEKRCYVPINIPTFELSRASFTNLEKECKAHGIPYRKDKKYMINNLRKHFFSPAHPESATIKIEQSLVVEKFEVKEELV